MSRVETIESEIKQLSPGEFAELRDWLLSQDADLWDAEFESDATSGRLDAVFAKAVADHHTGRSREL